MKKDKYIFNRLIELSIPTVFAFFLQSVYDIVDMFWVGKISYQAITALTLFSTILWIFAFLNEVIGSSSVSMISQSIGRKDYEAHRDICEQTLTFKFIMGILTMILFFIFLKPLLYFYTDDSEVINLALTYGRLRTFFIPIMFSSFSVNTIFRCSGDSKTPMKILVIAAITNMVLDPILMFDTIPYTNIPGFNLGIFGASLATVISTSLSFIIGFALLLRDNDIFVIHLPNLFRLIPSIDKKLITIGIPSGFQMLLRFGFEAIMLKFVSMYGVVAITAAGICSKLYGLAFMPMNGLLMGGSVLVGYFIGEDDIKSSEKTSKIAAYINGIIMLIFTAICFIFTDSLIGFFSKDPGVLKIGSKMLPASVAFISLLGYSLGRGVVFLGSGYNSPLLKSSVISQWAVQIPIMILFTKVLNLSAELLFLSYIPSDIIFFIMMIYYYRKGRWKYTRV